MVLMTLPIVVSKPSLFSRHSVSDFTAVVAIQEATIMAS